MNQKKKKTCHKNVSRHNTTVAKKQKKTMFAPQTMSISVCLKVIHLGPLKIHTRINHLSLEFGAIYLIFSDLTHIHPSPPPPSTYSLVPERV